MPFTSSKQKKPYTQAICVGAIEHELVKPTWQEIHKRVASFYCDAPASSTSAVYDNHAKYWASRALRASSAISNPHRGLCMPVRLLDELKQSAIVCALNDQWGQVLVDFARNVARRHALGHVSSRDARVSQAVRWQAESEASNRTTEPRVLCFANGHIGAVRGRHVGTRGVSALRAGPSSCWPRST